MYGGAFDAVEFEGEAGVFALLAFGVDGVIVRRHYIADNVKSEPCAARFAGAGLVGLIKSVPDMDKLLFGKALAGVLDGDLRLGVFGAGGNDYLTAVGGEFNGVVHQICNNAVD